MLKFLMKSYYVYIADYKVSNELVYTPDFVLRVPHILKKRQIIKLSINSKYCQTMHKYGINSPKIIDKVKDIYHESGET